jgi:phytanoyl-CoA hydroxylase
MYFLTSTDKIRPFLEKKATEILNESKENISTSKKINKKIFNKIGHALHALNPVYKQVTFSDSVKDIAKKLNLINPIVCQSMYIFKQPYIGGEVQIHQDGSYLHTDPLNIYGIWIALEDCTIENGCLSFLPGSNKMPLTRRFIRNPNKEEFDAGKYLIYDELDSTEYDESKFVPVEVKAGEFFFTNLKEK